MNWIETDAHWPAGRDLENQGPVISSCVSSSEMLTWDSTVFTKEVNAVWVAYGRTAF